MQPYTEIMNDWLSMGNLKNDTHNEFFVMEN